MKCFNTNSILLRKYEFYHLCGGVEFGYLDNILDFYYFISVNSKFL